MNSIFKNSWNLSGLIQPKQRRYLLIVVIAAAIGAAFGEYRVSKKPPSFGSRSRLVISGRLNISEPNIVGNDFMSVLGTQLEILTGEELRERAMIRLRLEHPEAVERPDLSAQLVPRTTIFQLAATASTPTYVQRYLDLVMDEYIAMRREQRLFSSRSVMEQMSSQIARLEKTLGEQEGELYRFKQQRNIVFWDQQATTAARFLSQLKNREASLRMQLEFLSRLERTVDPSDLSSRAGALQLNETGDAALVRPSQPVTVATALTSQRMKLQELEVEMEAASRIFLPKHPRYQRLAAEIAKMRRMVEITEQQGLAGFRSELAAIKGELEAIQSSMAEWERKVLESSQIQAEHQKLQDSVNRTRDFYQRLVASLQNIDFRKGVDEELIAVLNRASVAEENKPMITQELRSGAFFGFLVGLGVLYAALQIDRRAYSVGEVNDALGINVTVEVPKLPRRHRGGLVMAQPDCPSDFSEAIRGLRGSLVLAGHVDGRSLSLVVCSSTPGEGKSTVSLNLARAAADAGVKTLLIDTDLRRGSVAKRVGLARDTIGLADYVREGGDWRRFIHAPADLGFAVMPCGSRSAEVIDAMVRKFPQALIDEAKKEYDLVVIDAAPIVPVSDVIPFLSRVDRVLFVYRLRHTSLTAAKKALAILHRSTSTAPLIIANAILPAESQFDYYDYSSYRTSRPS